MVGVGTLLIAGAEEFDLSAKGVAAAVVIGGASAVALAGSYALLPRLNAYGLDLS